MKKLKQEEFISRAKEKWPNYDYSKVNYINNKTKVIVICPIHGEFEIRPDCLLNNTGCPSCGGTKKNDTQEFIKKANIVHNNFFSYDKCVYNGAGKKVIVTCPYHGDFEVKASGHLNGLNCKKCTQDGIKHEITKLPKINSSTKRYDTSEFIRKSIEKWGNKYTYEKTTYTKNNQHVTITCPIHGDFKITPNHFLGGRGCPKCGRNYRYTTEDFIEKAKSIYGDKYLYDNVEYISTHKPILIGCKEHGYFRIQPSNFLKGEGCPVCNQSKLEKEIECLLTNNNIEYVYQYKADFLNKLSLDFFIPSYNCAIECQGIQHFSPIEQFGGDEALKEQIKRDKEKEKICKNNNIKLLYYANYKYYFPYEVITDKDVLLTKILKLNENN